MTYSSFVREGSSCLYPYVSIFVTMCPLRYCSEAVERSRQHFPFKITYCSFVREGSYRLYSVLTNLSEQWELLQKRLVVSSIYIYKLKLQSWFSRQRTSNQVPGHIFHRYIPRSRTSGKRQKREWQIIAELWTPGSSPPLPQLIRQDISNRMVSSTNTNSCSLKMNLSVSASPCDLEFHSGWISTPRDTNNESRKKDKDLSLHSLSTVASTATDITCSSSYVVESTKRRVIFQERVRWRRIPTKDSLSPEERAAVWMTIDEFKTIAKTCRECIRFMENNPKQYRSRGLESRTRHGSIAKRLQIECHPNGFVRAIYRLVIRSHCRSLPDGFVNISVQGADVSIERPKRC